MAKKYLLYIHNDKQFDLEENKSELINELLDSHYGNFIEVPHVKVKKITKNKDTSAETSTFVEIPGVVKGSEFKPKPRLGECQRHHVDKSICHCA